MKSGGLGDAPATIGVADEAAVRLNAALEHLRAEQGRLTNAELDADKRAAQRNSMALALIAAVALLASAAAALCCSSLLRRPLAQVVKAARSIAEGDLSVSTRAEGSDAIGELVTAMQSMQASLRTLVSGVRERVDTITMDAREVALGHANLSSRTEQQASNLQETAASMEQMNAVVRSNAETAHEADAGSNMTDIVDQVRRVSELIGQINGSTSEQSSGIGQVNQSVANLDQMTQQNAALVEQSVAAAESLRQQADQLAEAVAVFRLDTSEAR